MLVDSRITGETDRPGLRSDVISFIGGTRSCQKKRGFRRALFLWRAKSARFGSQRTSSSFCSRRSQGCARNGFENCFQTTFGLPRPVFFDSAPDACRQGADLIFRDLILQSSKIETPSPEQAAEIQEPLGEAIDGGRSID